MQSRLSLVHCCTQKNCRLLFIWKNISVLVSEGVGLRILDVDAPGYVTLCSKEEYSIIGVEDKGGTKFQSHQSKWNK
jgi:hypothetical protein